MRFQEERELGNSRLSTRNSSRKSQNSSVGPARISQRVRGRSHVPESCTGVLGGAEVSISISGVKYRSRARGVEDSSASYLYKSLCDSTELRNSFWHSCAHCLGLSVALIPHIGAD